MNSNKKLAITLGLSAVLLANAVSVMATEDVYHAEISKTYSEVTNLVKKKKYKSAQKILKDILAKDPNNHEARAMLGGIYSKRYKLDAAYREFSKILDYEPHNSAAHNGMGTVYYYKTTSSDMQVIENKDKFFNMALKEFKAAVEADSENFDAYNNAGRVFEEMGQLDKAEMYYAKSLEINPDNSEAVSNLGSVLFKKHQVDEAIDKYKRAIALNSKNSSAYYRLGQAYISQGKYSKGIRELNTSLYLFPNSAPVQNMLGKAYELQGNQAAAINAYRKASFIKPEYSQPYLNIADIYKSRGDNDLAIAELRNAISVNPAFKEGVLKVAEISMMENKPDQAIEYYKKLVNDKKYAPDALKGLSRAYFTKAKDFSGFANVVSPSEYIKTEQALRKALDYNPNDLQLYLALLRVSRLSGNDYQSQVYLNKIVTETKFSPINAIIKGEAYLTYNKFAEADQQFKKALSFVDTAHDSAYLGEIFVMNRQYDVAKQAFYKALNLDSSNKKAEAGLNIIVRNKKLAKAHYNIANAFYKEGQRMAAVEELKKGLQLNPSDKRSQLLMAKSYEKLKYYPNALEHYDAYVHLIPTYHRDYGKYKRKMDRLQVKINKMKSKNQVLRTL